MKIALLKAVARSLMRTANRRLKEWVNSDIKNSNFSEIYEKIRYSNFYNSETNKFTTNITIDYNIVNSNLTPNDTLYYVKDTSANTIKYELDALGYTCN